MDENEDIQHTVLTVTAKDHDECKYRIHIVFAYEYTHMCVSVPLTFLAMCVIRIANNYFHSLTYSL